MAHWHGAAGAQAGAQHPVFGFSPSDSHQAGNFVREEILSAFIRLVAHTPELQAYTASKLFLALKSDISQESLTLAATWILGEYSDVLLEGGIVDDEKTTPVSTTLSRPWTILITTTGPGLRAHWSPPLLHGLTIRELSHSPVPSRCPYENCCSFDHLAVRTGSDCWNSRQVHDEPRAGVTAAGCWVREPVYIRWPPNWSARTNATARAEDHCHGSWWVSELVPAEVQRRWWWTQSAKRSQLVLPKPWMCVPSTRRACCQY